MRLISTVLLLLLAVTIYAGNEKYRLTLRDDPATTIVIGWNQTSGSNPVVYYGTTDYGDSWSSYPNSQGVSRSVSHKGMDNHFARLTGLTPNTNYYFVIYDSQGASERFWFRTAPDSPNERLSFIAGGDSRNNRTPRQNANLLVSKLKPHAVLFGGDMTDSGSNSQWDDWFDDWQLTISNDGRMYPIVATRGNHEGSNNDIYNLFDVPSSNVYYALTFGNGLVRTYTLNTEMSISGNQTNWLSSDLASNTNVTWKFAQYHKPMRPHTSSKSDGTNQYNYWADLFYNYQVNLVVECDAHTVKTTWPIRPASGSGTDEGFIRDDQNGTVYVGEGCWGAPLRDNNDSKDWTRASGEFNQFKWIFVDQGKIEVRTIQVDNATSVGEVSNSNPFSIPSNLSVWNPGNGDVITILNNNVELPEVAITAPANGTYYENPQTITISASASDSDGSIDRVDFYVNNALIATDNSASYSTNYTLASDGSYEIQAIAYDNDGNSETSSSVTVNVGVTSQSIDRRISSGMDDVEEESDGDIYDDSSDIELTEDWGTPQIIGLRFNNIDIPYGATIDNAYIQFTVDETGSSTTNLTIRGEDTDDSSPFTTSDDNVSNRNTTSASVTWSPSGWNSVDDAGADQRTPDLSSIIQEIIDRNGWSDGNDIAIVITGTGRRTAESYEGESGSAALLHIDYTVGGSSTPPSSTCEEGAVANEGFESNFGEWTNASGDDIDWTRNSGSTPSSSTGPSGAYSSSYYAYIESSNPNYPSNTANLVSNCLDLSGYNDPALSFYLHMYGSTMGTLNVQARENGGNWTTLWSLSGDQGNSWYSTSVSLADFDGPNVEIQFNGITGSSWRSDICIDNIAISDGSTARQAIQQLETIKQDNALNPTIEVYPNPFTENIHVNLTEDWYGGVIMIYGLNGSLILERKIKEGENSISISDQKLKTGIYFLKAENGDRVFEQKIIKN